MKSLWMVKLLYIQILTLAAIWKFICMHEGAMFSLHQCLRQNLFQYKNGVWQRKLEKYLNFFLDLCDFLVLLFFISLLMLFHLFSSSTKTLNWHICSLKYI